MYVVLACLLIYGATTIMSETTMQPEEHLDDEAAVMEQQVFDYTVSDWLQFADCNTGCR